MPRLIIFIDKDPYSIWKDLQTSEKVMFYTKKKKNFIQCQNFS